MRLFPTLLSLVTLTALLLPTIDVAASQNPDFSEELRALTPTSPQHLAQADRRKAEADRFFDEGLQQYGIGQFQEAIQSWEQALAIYREIRDQTGEGATLWNLGDVYNGLGEYQVAIDYYQQVRVVAQEMGGSSSEGEGIILWKLGGAYFELGEYEQAIDFFEQSLVIAREIGNLAAEGASLAGLGDAYLSLVQYRQAIDFFEQSLVIAREIGNRAPVDCP
jgi:tetratricopeptide (TPR) repeat protein